MSEPRKNVDAFFHRMANTDTVASRDMKVSPRDPKSFKDSLRSPEKNESKPETKKSPTQKKTSASFFERMSKADTYASRDMKDGKREPKRFEDSIGNR